ncbi:MAG: DUF3857 domain-containing protein [Bernardetiaceae bacterium]|nr:DUF3857 domain-containing protein [Bernardetiaceae bacterium]
MRLSILTLFCFCLPLFLGFSFVKAQKPDELLARLQQKYPYYSAVILEKKVHLFLDYDSLTDRFEIKAHHLSDVLHLKEGSAHLSQESIPYSSFTELKDLKAHTLIPNGKKYRIEEVTHFMTRDLRSEDIFYNDTRETYFYFPAVRPGARTVLSYTEVLKEPRFISAVYLNHHSLPTERVSYRVEMPLEMQVAHRFFGKKNDNISFRHFQDKKSRIYYWEGEQIPPYIEEKSSPPFRYQTPHVFVFINKVEFANGKIKYVLNDTQNLYHWYYQFIKHSDTEKLSEAQKQIIAQIIKNADTPQAKARSIYRWVTQSIKYIAFEDGMRGFVPDLPSEVMQKRYGDCKDMTALLVAMLREVGLEAYFAWIGSRDLPYTYENMPTPATDNHMIAVLKIQDKKYFLDATASYLPFGIPSEFIQGKEALIAIDSQQYKIEKVPIVTAVQNQTTDTAQLYMKDDSLFIEGKMSFEGYSRAIITPFLHEKGMQYEMQRNIIRVINPYKENIFLHDFRIENLYEPDLPLLIYYKVSFIKHIQKMYSDVFLNLNLHLIWKNTEISKTRKSDVYANFYFNQSHYYTLTIPKNYATEHIPPNFAYKDSLFGFEINYEKQNNTLIYNKKIYSQYLILKNDKFESWNKMIDTLHRAYRQNVALSKLY